MYRRFLNDTDYLGVITGEALSQITRNDTARFAQAEEAAEMSIVEYLSENYEVEAELNKGKYIAGYDRRITFPVGAHVYFEGRIYEVIQSISGYVAPSAIEYWEEYIGTEAEPETAGRYSQFGTYYKGTVVSFHDVLFICLEDNGYEFGNIRIPQVKGWTEVACPDWQPIPYDLWDVVKYEGAFYTLLSLEAFDNNVNPFASDNWGEIADYNPDYNEHKLSEHEYVVYQG